MVESISLSCLTNSVIFFNFIGLHLSYIKFEIYLKLLVPVGLNYMVNYFKAF